MHRGILHEEASRGRPLASQGQRPRTAPSIMVLRGSQPRVELWCSTRSLQTCEQIYFYCWRHPACESLFSKPSQPTQYLLWGYDGNKYHFLHTVSAYVLNKWLLSSSLSKYFLPSLPHWRDCHFSGLLSHASVTPVWNWTSGSVVLSHVWKKMRPAHPLYGAIRASSQVIPVWDSSLWLLSVLAQGHGASFGIGCGVGKSPSHPSESTKEELSVSGGNNCEERARVAVAVLLLFCISAHSLLTWSVWIPNVSILYAKSKWMLSQKQTQTSVMFPLSCLALQPGKFVQPQSLSACCPNSRQKRLMTHSHADVMASPPSRHLGRPCMLPTALFPGWQGRNCHGDNIAHETWLRYRAIFKIFRS